MSKRNTALMIGAAILVVIAAIWSLPPNRRASRPVATMKTAALQQAQPAQPIAIAGVTEPVELRALPFPPTVLSPPMQMLKEALTQHPSPIPQEQTALVQRVLDKYPHWSEGYAFRLTDLCKGTDGQAVLLAIKNTLAYANHSDEADIREALLPMRAKVEHDQGNDSAAMSDLETYIKQDPDRAKNFSNSGATAPEQSSGICTWNLTDLSAMVRKFPTDYRAFLLRGLYYEFFHSITGEGDDFRDHALSDFKKATELNPKSPLPHYFSAQVRLDWAIFKRGQMSMEQLARFEAPPIDAYSQAIAADRTFAPAFLGRANEFFHVKMYGQAVQDCNAALAIDAHYVSAITMLGDIAAEQQHNYDVISNYSKAIELTPRKLQQTSLQEGRAKAYMQTQQWDLAIADYTEAISLQLGGLVMLIDAQQFKSIYPEYRAIPDSLIATKLQQTFYPDMSYADFAKHFVGKDTSQKPFETTVLTDLYVGRSGAYVRAGRWHDAATDIHRALRGFPGLAATIERWQEAGDIQGKRFYVDLRSYDDANPQQKDLWLKLLRTDKEDGPYELEHEQVNCVTKQIRGVGFVFYDANGRQLSSGNTVSAWESAVPDSSGEQLLESNCQ